MNKPGRWIRSHKHFHMLFVFTHCCCIQCKQSMNKPGRWIRSHKHLDRFWGDHVGQALCRCVALWDQLPHDCLLRAMNGWWDGRTDGWMESFISSQRPLLYVMFIFKKKIKIVYLVVAILLAQDKERWDGQVIQEGDTLWIYGWWSLLKFKKKNTYGFWFFLKRFKNESSSLKNTKIQDLKI